MLDLIGSKVPTGGVDIFFELFFGSGAYDDAGYTGALKKPVEGDLGNRFAGFPCYEIERIDDFVEIFVFDLRAFVGGFVKATNGRQRVGRGGSCR